ncbi:hypothetical protein THAOC_07429 [Thalassiosira oceanica]|uniref:Uncharacterized protein n=1 Tax=Thalassiosira oceanica TaxID=159749 RepID=K0SXJ8_THAOC|nr:hypothetical protein THAOC_07429 [Thalassiosira oceanica]|mmetsp:Transcript_26748/g.60427  ORF Transcript_26748/g.60427 Transcript_26748/m.60427 type:complete len:359 (+) Transcript_26748:86-1162(+)|eukprot:EJK71153.1 hypothetical protein THAOC_07429 [Thalassiosira oceanica]
MSHRLLALVVIISEISGSLSQQHIKLTTSSSSLIATITADSDGPLSPLSKTSPGDLFKFEYTSSKFFHDELTRRTGDLDRSHVISTAVHIEDVEKVNGADLELKPALVFKAVITSTLSDVGLYKAVTRSPLTGGWQDKGAAGPDLAPILQKVSSAILLDELVAAGLVQHGAALDLTFQAYSGSLNERGVAATVTEILSEQKSGWLMFAAGFFFSCLLLTIVTACGYIYLRDSGKLSSWFGNDDGAGSVHYKGDVDVENATTASGILGLIGHHPLADISNSGMHRRRKKFSSQGSTDDSSASGTLSPTNSQLTNGTSKRKKNPLGITSMSVLNSTSFRTPQKVSSGKLVVYNAERMSRT